ncbi:uncharacterized protein [Palaemon carinicauda]|uniref:uncharacterized protein n=1 Tax=Palaemon carinicauda TaxID=392227 RepID=UPI0035B65778
MENEFPTFERPEEENTLDLGNVDGWPLFQDGSSYSENDLYGEVYIDIEQLQDPASTATPNNDLNFECRGRCPFSEDIFQDTDGQREQIEEIPFASMEITPKNNSQIKGQDIEVRVEPEPSTSYAISPYNIQVGESSLSRKQPWSVNATASDGFGGTSCYQPNTELTFSNEKALKTSGNTHSRHHNCSCAFPKYFMLKTSRGKYILKGRPMESNLSLHDHNIECLSHSVWDSNTLDCNSTQSEVALNSLMPLGNYSQKETDFSEYFQLESKSSKVNLEKAQPKTKSFKSINSNIMESTQSGMAVDFTPDHENYKLKSCPYASSCPLLTLHYTMSYPGRSDVAQATSISLNQPTNNFLEGEEPAFEHFTPKAQSLSSGELPYNLRHPRSCLIYAGAFASTPEVSYNEPSKCGSKQTLESANTTSLKIENDKEKRSEWTKPSKYHTVELSKVYPKSYYLRTRECRLQLEAQIQELEKKNNSLREIFYRLRYLRNGWYQILQRFPHLHYNQK